MTTNAESMIVPNDFPELKSLVWNRDPARAMPACEAFALYERNWRFVDTGRLTEREVQLIRDLAATYGNGVLLVVNGLSRSHR
ncbi:hypothetical protein ACOJBM_20240 [Rhizobium beringeri]|jgi:hypothetical protein|uniref:hypothetical protein n=1 Tax=Rhizobium TaxID=379 RepID=UPI001030A70F|nr:MULTISPECIES: hypothetical protein [Rhizobium]TBD03740.1 hypothetical protein ELH21_04725 [Rhizobium leguminosarum]WSG90112.1 hypothetical protein U8P73_06400 [Rhizobium beringeri]